jgi:inhibitor of KinA sporulation pathway (predicted exonuclease)
MQRATEPILVVDVEATCWQGNPPPGEQNEIIEIGVCLLDPTTRERGEGESILVRPQRSRVSAFCTELTTLTKEQVDAGIPFEEACALLLERYRSAERVWASYGAYDRNQFRRQCAAFGVEYPFGDRHLNVKARFADTRGGKQVGMARALEILGLPLEGTHHRGGDDSRNIARILAHLLKQRTVKELLQDEGGGPVIPGQRRR